jgi:hypothetical protein
MINQFTGGQDVLELFARVDTKHPLPPNFTPWGNQITERDAVTAQPSALPEPACANPVDGELIPLAPLALRLIDDDLDIPNFLRIGHPQCTQR